MEPLDKETRLKQLWEQFLKLKPTNEQVFSVIAKIKPLKEAAINRLWQQGATKEELVSIMLLNPLLSTSIQKLLDTRNQQNEVIQQILEKMETLVEEIERKEIKAEET